MKVLTWNVNGVRAREAQLLELLEAEKPDVVCLQELKASIEQLSPALYGLTGLLDYHSFWHGGGKGYSGVSVHLKKSRFAAAPKSAHPPFDMEHRVVEAHTDTHAFVSMYVPNGGKDFDAKLAFLKEMAAYARSFGHKQVVFCGDFNVARADVDVHKSQRKPGVIGQRPEERELFEAFLDGALVDVGRALAPDDDHLFTWWPYWKAARQRNLGWRIDYVFASTALAAKAREGKVMREFGTSDHAPVVITFDD
ncbi:MAG TPA: exodeoxyribonuclease III [Polyangiaceae bacterium]